MKVLVMMGVILFIAVGCKKNNSDAPGQPNTRIKTVQYSNTTDHYEYDQAGRIKKVTEQGGEVSKYEYLPGQVLLKYYDAGGSLLSQTNFDLNAEGLAVNEYASNASPSTGRKYEYDAQQHNTRYYSTSPDGTYFETRNYFSPTGLLDSTVSIIRSNAGGIIGHTKKTYQYSGINVNTISDREFGNVFFGKGSSQVPDRETTTSLLTGVQSIINYGYDYDNRNRIVTTAEIQSSGNTETTTYTYY